MTDPIRRSNGTPFAPPDTNQSIAGSAPLTCEPPEQASTDPAIGQLTAKYKPNVSAFLATQAETNASSSAPPSALELSKKQRDTEYAQLAHAAYGAPPPPGWHSLDADELQAAGLDPESFTNPETGFKAALLQNEINGEFVLAFRGTEDGPDWRTNFNQGGGALDPQYEQAAHLAVAVTDAVGSATMVGHSLGGGLAATAAIASRSEAVTFNAAGLHSATLEYAATAERPFWGRALLPGEVQLALNRVEEHLAHRYTDQHITNYRLTGDPLTALQEVLPIPAAQGTQADVTPVSDYGVLDTFFVHSTTPLIDAMRGREYEAQP